MNQLDAAVKTHGKTQTFTTTVIAYLEAIKPRETALLLFIGFATAAIAPTSPPPARVLVMAMLAILFASAGVNGLTCYLDRGWDRKMERTRKRPLPSGRIAPPERVLPFVIGLTVVGLAIGYAVNPYVALAGALGTVTALVARKTWVTHYLGVVSSLAPIWMGWLAVYQGVNAAIVSISTMVAVWVLIHVWSLMLAYRDDYRNAGLKIFPVTASVEASIRWIAFLTLVLAATTLSIYQSGMFGWFFGISALILSVIAVVAGFALALAKDKASAWRLYKYSAFPFLGLIFLAMIVDRFIA